jgi:hypothetical protein
MGASGCATVCAAIEPHTALAPGTDVEVAAAPQTEREMLQVVRNQMMDDEAEVPWDAVHSFWRSRRSRWRQVKPDIRPTNVLDAARTSK